MKKGILDYVFYTIIFLIALTLAYLLLIRNNFTSELVLDNDNFFLQIGETAYINAKVNGDKNARVTYLSTNPNIAAVSLDGIVTGIEEGHAFIIVNYIKSDGETISKQCSINVGNNYDILRFTNKALLIKVGSSHQLEYITSNEVSFVSNDTNIVSVDKTGQIVALKEGRTSISAFADGKKINSIIVYAMQDVNTSYTNIPSSIDVKNEQMAIKVGEVSEIEYDYTPSDVNQAFFELSSNDEKIVKISNNNIVGVSVGHAIVTIKSLNGITSSILVNVDSMDIEKLELTSSNSVSLKVGETNQIIYSILPPEANQDLVYNSSDPSIAIVSDTGLITAVAKGNAVITASNKKGDKTIQVNISVTNTGENKSGVNKGCNSSDPADTTFNNCFVNSHRLVLSASSISIPAGGTGTVQVSLPSECGTNVGFTRKSADGETGWQNYVSQSRTNETNTGFTWVIKANSSSKGKSVIVSQTIQYNSRSPSGKCVGNVKSMATVTVRIT